MTAAAVDAHAPPAEVAQVAASLVPEASGVMTALQAVERIRSWHAVLSQLASVAEVHIMEDAWTIRRHHPDRAAFGAFLDAQGISEILPPDRAWVMAETWEVARTQRALRDLAADSPQEAIRFVREFVDAGAERQLAALDEDDRQVAEILSSPPRTRNQRMRALIQESRVPPVPVNAATHTAPVSPDAFRLAVNDLRAAVDLLDKVAAVLPEDLTTRTVSDQDRQAIIMRADMGIGWLEAIADAAKRPDAED